MFNIEKILIFRQGLNLNEISLKMRNKSAEIAA